MEISIEHLLGWLEKTNNKIQEKKSYLTDLDQAIGDGDHGINIARGFQEVQKKVSGSSFEDIGSLFQLVGNTLMQKVGGASGPIYGMAFLKASPSLKGKKTISTDELIDSLEMGAQAIQAIGKAEVGYKTLLDVWSPITTRLKNKKGNINWEEMITYTWDQVEATKDRVAKKGRAAYLGDRSIGHLDPGSVSSYYLFEALFETLWSGADIHE